jgi:chromosome segregation ATPase
MKKGGEPMNDKAANTRPSSAAMTTDNEWDAALTDLESKIRELRETRHTLAIVKAENMRIHLYEQYTAITTDWSGALDEWAAKADELGEARRVLAELKSDLEVYESSVLLAEESAEGRINGSNEPKRKRQATVLLGNLADEDADYAATVTALEEVQLRADALQRDLDNLEKRISFLRNQARMVSGLCYALAGV